MVREIINTISEGCGKKPSELYEEFGVETDESAVSDPEKETANSLPPSKPVAANCASSL